MKERELWLALRQALLMVLDTIERHLEIEPRTAELKRAYKDGKLIV